MTLPTRIDVITKDGRCGVVLDCSPTRRLTVHWGTITRREGQKEVEHKFIEEIDCLQLKEVRGWDARGSAVTRLSTVTRKKRPERRTT